MTNDNQSPMPNLDGFEEKAAGLVATAQLAWRIFWDHRVSNWLKVIPVVSTLYIISPFDFIPDFLAIIGWIDDLGSLGILAGSVWAMIHFTPDEIRQEHEAVIFGHEDEEEWTVEDTPPGAPAEEEPEWIIADEDEGEEPPPPDAAAEEPATEPPEPPVDYTVERPFEAE